MKLNKKGYMLVEIILASALAFGLAYFILELTLKVKEKDDDLITYRKYGTSDLVTESVSEFIELVKNDIVKKGK